MPPASRALLAELHAREAAIARAVEVILPAIADAAELLACAIEGGGRLYCAGSGASGVASALDFARWLPELGVPSRQVEAVVPPDVRGFPGARPRVNASAEEGAWALREGGIAPGDALLAIAASGAGDFALGALEAAHAARARTLALVCVTGSELADAAELVLAPPLGELAHPSALALSARRAQHAVLHLLGAALAAHLAPTS